MDAIWSFCGETFFKDYNPRWYTMKHCWYSWILSLGTVSKSYPMTTLYTDSRGAKWLLDKLDLSFVNVVINLDVLRDTNPQWWCYSKLKAYASHLSPFVHFDNDVFLWKKLPSTLESASVIAQSFEPLSKYYRIKLLKQNLKKTGGWLPEEFIYYSTCTRQRPFNCGIIGGNHLDFLHYYANLGINFIEKNAATWNLYEDLIRESCVTEQYFLSACFHYYTHQDHSFGDLTLGLLFKKEWQPWRSEITKELGYTHLIAESKGDQDIARRLEKRVIEEYPTQYENVQKYQPLLSFYV